MTAPDPAFWLGKRVLLTGHTGFKGAWLAIWLARLGADVTGLALAPAERSLYRDASVDDLLTSRIVDLRQANAVAAVVHEERPEIVFHLAAQALVREGYRDPIATYASNVMGTVHLLDALRAVGEVKSVVVVTTDKVYRNREWAYPYREDDALGGHDPYSASKAAAEIVTASYRDAFLRDRHVAVSTARAGNVIGGGDFASDRLIPDAVRAWEAGRTLQIRRPDAVRPWQHVLDPLAGYLRLAARQWHDAALAGAYNFGPSTSEAIPVGAVATMARDAYGRGEWAVDGADSGPHEAGRLALEVAHARDALGVEAHWALPDAVRRTMGWYRQHAAGASAHDLCAADIDTHGIGPSDRDLRVRRLRMIHVARRAPSPVVNRLLIEPTPIAGLMRVQRQRLGDARGDLTRIFCADELRDTGWNAPLMQLNLTRTRARGTVRGMHFQRPPHAEIKLVQCLLGEVFDVAVDLRSGSPTFLQWHAERLSGDNDLALLIPAGFAHGFQTLTDDVEMLYAHSAAYAADAEAGIHPQDPTLAIAWPLPVEGLSARDAAHAPIDGSITA